MLYTLQFIFFLQSVDFFYDNFDAMKEMHRNSSYRAKFRKYSAKFCCYGAKFVFEINVTTNFRIDRKDADKQNS